MKRREFMRTAVGAATGWLLNAAPSRAEEQDRRGRPNILFILTDQQHAGMMSCTGNRWLNTPALDSLAAAGMRFERAYATFPVCVPSRFSLQTGLMPSAVGMRSNYPCEGQVDLTDAQVRGCLGHLLRSAGYETVYGGKIHLPMRMNNIESLGYRLLTRNRRRNLAQACVDFLHRPHTRPFFLFTSFINPHDICYMAINAALRAGGKPVMDNADSRIMEEVLEPVRSSGDVERFVKESCPPLPGNFEIPEREPECIATQYVRGFRAYVRENWGETEWRLHRWAYCRLTEMVDGEIAIVLDALRETGLDKNTLVVFTSDHGDLDAAHRLEHKDVLYEESVGVPFIMSHPGAIPAGAVDDVHLVSNGLDLLPTLCDYAGVASPSGLDGISLRALAEGRNVTDWRRFLVAESKHGRMLRTDRVKYCIYESGANREQLVDLVDDPGEMRNLAGLSSQRPILEHHRALLRDWVARTGDRIAAGYIHA